MGGKRYWEEGPEKSSVFVRLKLLRCVEEERGKTFWRLEGVRKGRGDKRGLKV